MKRTPLLILSGVLCIGGIAAGVQFKDAAVSVAEGYAAAIEQPQTRIISAFSDFAGSETNARSLVAGLRQAGEVTLTAPAKGGQAGATTRFTPPTRPLDYSEIRVSLTLARAQLAQLGIDRPTPVQIKAVLAGGGVATRVSGQSTTPFLLPGVLQLRAGGMGWAKIAEATGVTLGTALNGNAHPAALTASPISSAWIATSVAVAAPNVAVAKSSSLAQRPASGEPGLEIRRTSASLVAAAENAATAGNAGNFMTPNRVGGSSTAIVPAAAIVPAVAVVPAAAVVMRETADEPARHEEIQAAD
jgi:hypothetical protein